MLHARCNPKGGGDSGQDSDGDVDDFLPDFLFVHVFLVFSLLNSVFLVCTFNFRVFCLLLLQYADCLIILVKEI